MTHYFVCDLCAIETKPVKVKEYGKEPLPDGWQGVFFKNIPFHLCRFCSKLPMPMLQKQLSRLLAATK